MRRDLVYRDEIMDSLVKEYNRKRTNDGLKLAWIEKAVNDVKPAPIDLPDNNVGDMIFIQSAIEAIRAALLAWSYMPEWRDNKIIEAIKQLPPIQPVNCSEFPNNSDVVDRQKAKNAICNACGKIDCDEMDTCEKLDIPSEGSKALEWQYHSYIPHNKYCPKCKKDSPYNKRGKWIRTGSGSLYDHYECSVCGKLPKWECLGDNRWKIAFTDFCPNCGAKMEATE